MDLLRPPPPPCYLSRWPGAFARPPRRNGCVSSCGRCWRSCSHFRCTRRSAGNCPRRASRCASTPDCCATSESGWRPRGGATPTGTPSTSSGPQGGWSPWRRAASSVPSTRESCSSRGARASPGRATRLRCGGAGWCPARSRTRSRSWGRTARRCSSPTTSTSRWTARRGACGCSTWTFAYRRRWRPGWTSRGTTASWSAPSRCASRRRSPRTRWSSLWAGAPLPTGGARTTTSR